MRDELEIHRAHDILTAVVLKELPLPLDAETQARVIAALDALCWVLEHDRSRQCDGEFSKNLAQIEEAAKRLGFKLELRGGAV